MNVVKPKSRRRKLKIILWSVIGAILIGALALGALMGYYLANIGGGIGGLRGIKQVFTPPFHGRTLVRVLVLGEDDSTARMKNRPRGLADTIILASFDLNNNSVSALSIPRDTMVEIPGYQGKRKINSAHSLGGPALCRQVVEGLTGVRPDYFIKTNIMRFKELVDIVGGVDLEVEKDMRYTDNWGGLHIDLKKGYQHLDGDKAMQYVRFRHDALGDLSRIERQQKFLKALAAKASSRSNIPRLPSMMKAVGRNVYTDMTVKDLLSLAKFMRDVTEDSMQTAVYPGTPENIDGGSYWVPDYERGREVVIRLFFMPIVAGLPKVEVLNGSGKVGAAQIVADALQSKGYRVVAVKNADSFDYGASQVIARKENLQGVDIIAGIVNSTEIKQEVDETATVDVTVIVGKNCTLLGSTQPPRS